MAARSLGARQCAYRADGARFLAFVGKPLPRVTLGDVQAFADSLQHLAPNSRKRALSAIKSLLSKAQKIGYLPFNVGAAVELSSTKNTLRSASCRKNRSSVCCTPLGWAVASYVGSGAEGRGGRIADSQVWRIVKATTTRAGFPAEVSPYWLRHALDRGAPIILVQATLAHASVQTTGTYLRARPNESRGRYLSV